MRNKVSFPYSTHSQLFFEYQIQTLQDLLSIFIDKTAFSVRERGMFQAQLGADEFWHGSIDFNKKFKKQCHVQANANEPIN